MPHAVEKPKKQRPQTFKEKEAARRVGQSFTSAIFCEHNRPVRARSNRRTVGQTVASEIEEFEHNSGIRYRKSLNRPPKAKPKPVSFFDRKALLRSKSEQEEVEITYEPVASVHEVHSSGRPKVPRAMHQSHHHKTAENMLNAWAPRNPVDHLIQDEAMHLMHRATEIHVKKHKRKDITLAHKDLTHRDFTKDADHDWEVRRAIRKAHDRQRLTYFQHGRATLHQNRKEREGKRYAPRKKVWGQHQAGEQSANQETDIGGDRRPEPAGTRATVRPADPNTSNSRTNTSSRRPCSAPVNRSTTAPAGAARSVSMGAVVFGSHGSAGNNALSAEHAAGPNCADAIQQSSRKAMGSTHQCVNSPQWAKMLAVSMKGQAPLTLDDKEVSENDSQMAELDNFDRYVRANLAVPSQHRGLHWRCPNSEIEISADTCGHPWKPSSQFNVLK
jgi:hypothetical protein